MLLKSWHSAEPARLADQAWLFQPKLSVEAADGSAAFIRRTLRHDQHRMDTLTYMEERQMAMLYRHQVEFAVGHGVAVHAETAPDDPHHAVRIMTQVAPVYEVPTQTPPTPDEIPDLAGLLLDMKGLAETPAEELAEKLNALPTAYANWIHRERQKRIDDPTLSEFIHEADAALRNCERALERIRAGITLLTEHPQAAEAFRFANEAIWLQRIHTIFDAPNAIFWPH